MFERARLICAPGSRFHVQAPERMLWGTDWPHVMLKGRMPNDGDLCDLIERWMPDATARTRILVDNPAELYGFGKEEKIGS